MTIEFYGHPFSSYCQKALIALYESDIPFQWRVITPDNEAISKRFESLWPIRRFPVLVDDERTVMESSIIIEYLDLHHPGRLRMIPTDAGEALEVRSMDRFFDNYIHAPVQKIVFDALRPPEHKDPYGASEARRMLDTAYEWIDQTIATRAWAAGDDFSLADCAAAPALFYADWTHPIPETHLHLRAYRQRLLSRPSFARAVDEARPYRAYFPLGAPDRD